MKCLGLIFSQFLGSLLACILVLFFIPTPYKAKEILGIPYLSFGSTFMSGFFFETLAIFTLTWMIFSISFSKKESQDISKFAFFTAGPALAAMLVSYSINHLSLP